MRYFPINPWKGIGSLLGPVVTNYRSGNIKNSRICSSKKSYIITSFFRERISFKLSALLDHPEGSKFLEQGAGCS